MDETYLARFWAKVDASGDCWVWKGRKDKGGYGGYGWPISKRAHRISYEIAYGEIPNGLYVLHRCDNRRCVRPDHLFLGTNDDNMADMVAKGRAARGERNISHRKPELRRGEKNGRSKLTPDQVRSIRAQCVVYKRGIYQKLAKEHGVDSMTIRRIALGKLWRHLD